MYKNNSFTEVEARKLSHDFVLCVYKITRNFPKCEISGLSSHFRRVTVSITGNITEGYKRISKKVKIRFYNIFPKFN